MNPLGLKVIRVDCPAPALKVLSAQQFEALVWPVEYERGVRSRAAALLMRARVSRARMILQAEDRLRERQASLLEEFERGLEAQRKQVIADAVEWYVVETAIEDEAVARIESVVRELVAGAVEKFFTSAEVSRALAARVGHELQDAMEYERIQICINALDADAVGSRLPQGPNLTLSVRDDVCVGQAVVKTPQMQLRVDVGEQLRDVLEQLRGARRPEPVAGRRS